MRTEPTVGCLHEADVELCLDMIVDPHLTSREARAMAKYVCNSYKTPPNLYPQDVKLRSLCDMALVRHPRPLLLDISNPPSVQTVVFKDGGF